MSLKKHILHLLIVITPAQAFRLSKTQVFTIMLDPAGDAQHAGRKIGDHLERGPTLEIAHAVKKNIEETHSGVRVILTRFPGETIQPRQNASFANRLDIDLYLSIHFFKQTTPKPVTHLFFFCSDPTTDFWSFKTQELAFVKASEIHKQSIDTSKNWADEFFTILQRYRDRFDTSKPLGIPFKPLYGIKAPSIGIEISLSQPEEWQYHVKPITDSINALITKLKKESRSHGIFS